MPLDPTTLERYYHSRCIKCGKGYEYWPDLDPPAARLYCSPECTCPDESQFVRADGKELPGAQPVPPLAQPATNEGVKS